jgi:hypothetical protein
MLENGMDSTTLKHRVSQALPRANYPIFLFLSIFRPIKRVWLHHHRLGRPSFKVIKILFPSLFKGLNVESFHYEVCELARHKRESFPVSNKRSSFPFYLIHSDIWGPSTIPNVSGTR